MLQVANTQITDIGPVPTRNATLVIGPDTHVSTKLEGSAPSKYATLGASNQQTAKSSLPTMFTIFDGYSTIPKATLSTGASKTGSAPNPTNDVFANSGDQQNVKQKATIAGAAIGAISGSALLGVAMFMVSSRYGRRRRYRRASVTSSSQSSMEIRSPSL
ncbi:hypothetical protein NQ176_g8686 [Zarea fungicola]|uniref:Uncharacterized protein n=1 Tax=Zarea fungicola TaxID=93591 RepID=A0ACC1MQV3_9HYPO|nr:hypothetical protein NQ176_g8686 [Lecanicillium fungicola]